MSKGYSIRVSIGGKKYGIISDEKPDYLADVAHRVDVCISSLLEANPSLTYEKAAVLAALKFCDDSLQNISGKTDKTVMATKDESDNLRQQIIEYSKDLARLTNENKMLNKSLSELKSRYNERMIETGIN